jgi:uncharacterized protein (DUF302 family)
MIKSGAYGLSVSVPAAYEQAREQAIVELKEQGFGVLTEIDVKQTLKQKLDVDFRKYTILGACNPPLAHRALSTETDIGLLLPCNLIVYENDDQTSTVAAIDPEVQLGVVGRPELKEVAAQVRERLEKVLDALARGSG